MKKTLLILTSILTLNAFSQPVVGTYSGGSSTVTMTTAQIDDMWDSIQLHGSFTGTLTSCHVYDTSFSSPEIPYLVFEGTKSGGESILVGFLLDRNSGNYELPDIANGGKVHSCVGVMCSGCKFSRNWIGIIQGCRCQSPVDPGPSYCTHSVSTGGGGSQWLIDVLDILIGLL